MASDRWNPDNRKLSWKSKNTGRIDGGYGQGNEPDAGSKEDQCACVLRNFEEENLLTVINWSLNTSRNG